LKNAHQVEEASDKWNHKYSRQKAAYPVESLKGDKFWASVARVDNAYGDRNFICSCIPVESYEDETAGNMNA
jgi:glycine dehydrogenase